MKNTEMIKRLSTRLEKKVEQFEQSKLKTMSNKFYDLSSERQMEFILRNNQLRMEIDSLKKEIDNMEDDYVILKDKYNNKIHDGDLWLGDVLDIEQPKFRSNNLIVSPVGSGKSYVIKNKLAPEGSKYQLLLVPSRHLKNSVAPEISGDSKRKMDSDNVFTSGNRAAYGSEDYKIHVMTYAEFGIRVRNNDNFLTDNGIEQIYCDEVHSLVEYKNYSSDESLVHAMRYLFQEQIGISIYYFTATMEHLDTLRAIDPEKFATMSVFNYLKYPNIKKYTNLAEYEVNHFEQIREHLAAFSEDFINYGYKGLLYNNTITGQKRLAEILVEEGFTPLVLWSTNTKSEHGEMDAEQLRALDELIETEMIPEGYNFLVINNAMREGWNLKDDKVELAIVNTISETDQIQARGRIRKNISTLIIRTDSRELVVDEVNVANKFLNAELDKDMKEELAVELNILNSNGKLVKWITVKNLLVANGYEVSDKRTRQNGKQIRVSVISKK